METDYEQLSPTEAHQRRQQRRQKQAQRPSIEMDMNPMVDLAFLLLTFFMLATTFSRPQAMELLMPVQPDEEAPEKEQPVKASRVLHILLTDKNRIFWFHGRASESELSQTSYETDGLRQLLTRKNREINKMLVLLKPDSTSAYRNLVDALDELTHANIQRYAIAELEPEDRQLLQNRTQP